jgi:glyoxylase-like metal-dependent hydrolase (beta-lactamase superfamily II)/rhodanese-related sulfurtransferase
MAASDDDEQTDSEIDRRREMAEIAPADLKSKLEAGESLRVVDIREPGEFAAWHIVGAENLPVIDALSKGDMAPLTLAAESLSGPSPVVTVCRGGKMSVKAATFLRSLGHDAISLEGGMRGWGGIWSEAPIDAIEGVTMIQIRRNGKGCLSYLFGADGQAAVVDPASDVAAYLGIAEREGLRITHVLETHIHADHLSRARELCAATGAELVMHENQRATYPFRSVADGDKLDIGGIVVEVVATPGHTSESVCYLVSDKLLLTGDTLFVGAVGRPDLEKGDAGAEAGARTLFRSLKDRLLDRFDDVVFFPAHHGKPIALDGVPVSSTVATARSDHALLRSDEQQFVDSVLSRLQAKPGNFAKIIGVNEGRIDPNTLNLVELEEGPNCCAAG